MSENIATLVSLRRGLQVDYPEEWNWTPLYPSESPSDDPPPFDFAFSIDPRAKDPHAWIGAWFNRLPPDSQKYPKLMVLAHPLPPLTFAEFAEGMRAKLVRMGGEELKCREGLQLGGHPAGEYRYALGERRIRIRVTWHNGHRVAVFFAGDEREQVIASRAFELLASGLRFTD